MEAEVLKKEREEARRLTAEREKRNAETSLAIKQAKEKLTADTEDWFNLPTPEDKVRRFKPEYFYEKFQEKFGRYRHAHNPPSYSGRNFWTLFNEFAEEMNWGFLPQAERRRIVELLERDSKVKHGYEWQQHPQRQAGDIFKMVFIGDFAEKPGFGSPHYQEDKARVLHDPPLQPEMRRPLQFFTGEPFWYPKN